MSINKAGKDPTSLSDDNKIKHKDDSFPLEKQISPSLSHSWFLCNKHYIQKEG
jgi:hypothetical protein